MRGGSLSQESQWEENSERQLEDRTYVSTSATHARCGSSFGLTDVSHNSRELGYNAAMAANPIFHQFPEPCRDQQLQLQHCNEMCQTGEHERFFQKRFPIMYVNLTAQEHPAITDIQYDNEGFVECPLCKLDRNTLDSIKVLKPHEVKPYLESYHHNFTEDQVNIHLAHTIRGGENVIGVIQNMTLDLISKSYSLANSSSLRIMSRLKTHMGRAFFLVDQDVAKVHGDAVKQFIGLASTCQALMKFKPCDSEGTHANDLLS